MARKNIRQTNLQVNSLKFATYLEYPNGAQWRSKAAGPYLTSHTLAPLINITDESMAVLTSMGISGNVNISGVVSATGGYY